MNRTHRLAASLVAIACLAGTPALAEDAEDESNETQSVVQKRIDDAQERLASAAEDLATAWKTRLRGREAERAFLGVLIAGESERGILVGGLSPDGGAERAGILPDDIIVAIDGESLQGDGRPLRRLQKVLDTVEPGGSVALAITRDGEELEFDVITTPSVSVQWLDDLLDHEWLSKAGAWTGTYPRRSGRRPGLELVDIGEDLGDYFGVDAGVLVLDTPADSPLQPGDIVRRIAGAAVSSAEDAYGLLRRIEAEAEAQVRRKNRNITVVLQPQPEGPRPRMRKRSVIVVDPDDVGEYEEDEVEVEVEVETEAQ